MLIERVEADDLNPVAIVIHRRPADKGGDHVVLPAPIDANLNVARKLDVPGTAGIIVDGKLLGASPHIADLDSIIQRRLAMRSH